MSETVEEPIRRNLSELFNEDILVTEDEDKKPISHYLRKDSYLNKYMERLALEDDLK